VIFTSGSGIIRGKLSTVVLVVGVGALAGVADEAEVELLVTGFTASILAGVASEAEAVVPGMFI
jgi:hypothetical protein